MKTKLVHLLSPKQGGVLDYVDVCLSQDFEASEKLTITKEQVLSIHLPEHCLLHYSGYGFTNRGAPLWLLNKVKTDRARIKNFGVFFHELYAFGPPWGSAFWLSPVQRHIARRLAEMSDFWITNSEASSSWLCKFASQKPHALLPVFSNVGEMQAYEPERIPKIVIFGGEHLRTKTYINAGVSLFEWAKNDGLIIHDIGPNITNREVSYLLQREGVIQHGRLDSESVSAYLKTAMFGVVAYQSNCAAKSGVFASYCAHGVCPVLISSNFDTADGLIASQHYIAGIPNHSILPKKSKIIGAKAWHWYQAHKVRKHISTIQSLLNVYGNE